MSFSHTMGSRYEDDEDNSSPNNARAQTLGHETLFQFFRKKSKRDLDRSYSSARKSGRKNEKTSPNVQLLKELNSSSSPFKAKKPTASSVSPFRMTTTSNQSPFKLLSPFNNNDDSNEDEDESSKRNENKKPANPLFVKLIQNGSHRKKKSDAPTGPPPLERFSVSVPKERPQERNTHTDRVNSHSNSRGHEEKTPPVNKRASLGPKFSTPIMEKTDHDGQARQNTVSTHHQTNLERRFSASLAKENEQSHEDLLSEINSRLATYTNTHTHEKVPQDYANILDELDVHLRTDPQQRRKESHQETMNPRTRKAFNEGANPNNHITPKRTQRSVREDQVETDWAKNTLGPYIEDYEHKLGGISSVVQRQFHQISRLANKLNTIEDFDTEELKLMVEDLELTTITVSKCLKDGLFNIHGSTNLVEKIEKQYKQEIRKLNEGLDQARSTMKLEKNEHDLKLEELLSYTESLKRKQASSNPGRGKSNSRDGKIRKHHEDQSIDLDASVEVMRKDIRQLNNRNQDLEIHVKELEKENQAYRQQNYKLKENEESLREDAALLRSRLDDALLKLNKQQLTREKRENRPTSPEKALKGVLKKSGRGTTWEQEGELTKSEVDYLNYRLDILAKENEDLVRRLTDKVFIERENKTLLIKNQELTDALKTKMRENEHLTKSLDEIQDKMVQNTNYPIYAAVTKHYTMDGKNQGRMTHW